MKLTEKNFGNSDNTRTSSHLFTFNSDKFMLKKPIKISNKFNTFQLGSVSGKLSRKDLYN